MARACSKILHELLSKHWTGVMTERAWKCHSVSVSKHRRNVATSLELGLAKLLKTWTLGRGSALCRITATRSGALACFGQVTFCTLCRTRLYNDLVPTSSTHVCHQMEKLACMLRRASANSPDWQPTASAPLLLTPLPF